MPPSMPGPSHMSHSWWVYTATAPISRPPHQSSIATKPALRGPARSSQPPHTAAAAPRNTKNSVYIQPSSLIFQSQVVENILVTSDMSAGQAIADLALMARDNG